MNHVAAKKLAKQRNLFHSSTIISVMTLFSRTIGFVRDMLIAQLFGAQAGMDAFYIAFRIPNFMRRLFAEGAFSQAFIPVLTEYQQNYSFHEVRIFVGRIAGQLGAILLLITILGIIGAPIILHLFAPGFGESTLQTILATQMLRLTFPFLMFISLTAMYGAVLNTYGYFAVPALTPVLLNISMILASLYLCPYLSQPVLGLAWGVLIAGIIQFIFQLPFLYHRRLLVRPQISWSDDGVKQVLKLMIPALFGVSIAQVNIIIDSIFASFLQVGSVTWLYYTDRLTDFPLGVFGVAIATVILPYLARRHAAQDKIKYAFALDWGIRFILLIGIPASIGLALFSMPLIVSCFTYGKFTTYDLLQTQKSLIALALGVPAFMLVKILASGFYARRDIKTPVKIGATAMIVNSLLCCLLIWPLAHAGLALASTLAGYLNCGLLLRLLIRQGIYTPSPGWPIFALQLFIANAILAMYLFMMLGGINDWLTKSAVWRITTLTFDILGAVVLYLMVLQIVKVYPVRFSRQITED